jgi:hypothetical protein
MTPSEANEIVVDAVKQAIRCNRCLEEKPLEFPMPVEGFIKWCNKFRDNHSECNRKAILAMEERE